MSPDAWTHALSFVVRFNDHFTGRPVTDELPVRLAGSLTRPAPRRDGRGARQADGTYRFVDIASGVHRVRWLPPFSPAFRGWVSWDAPLDVAVPVASAVAIIERDLWRGPSAAVPPATTAVRGQLRGAGVAGLEVRIGPPPLPPPSRPFTRADAFGEFLFVLPEPLASDAQGRLDLRIEVAAGARAVSGGAFRPSGAGAAFAGSDFRVRPGVSSRIVFQVA